MKSPGDTGTPPQQIAHYDAVGVPLADRDFVDAYDFRRRRPEPPQLLLHVLHLEGLDRLPVQVRFPGDRLDGSVPAAPPHVEGEPLGEEGTVGQPVELLLFHFAAAPAIHPAEVQHQVDARIPAGQIADPVNLVVVRASMRQPAHTAACFFARRCRRMIRAIGSPKMPTTTGSGRKPGKRYASHRRRRRRDLSIRKS